MTLDEAYKLKRGDYLKVVKVPDRVNEPPSSSFIKWLFDIPLKCGDIIQFDSLDRCDRLWYHSTGCDNYLSPHHVVLITPPIRTWPYTMACLLAIAGVLRMEPSFFSDNFVQNCGRLIIGVASGVLSYIMIFQAGKMTIRSFGAWGDRNRKVKGKTQEESMATVAILSEAVRKSLKGGSQP